MSDTYEMVKEIRDTLNRHIREYRDDIHGDGNEPGLKTITALNRQQLVKHSKDIEDGKSERRKWFWTVVGMGAALVVAIVAPAIIKNQNNNTQEKR